MLPVFYQERQVGRLEEDGTGLSFTYGENWLRDETGFDISLSMPRSQSVHLPDRATPWFANLLPEDRQLEQVSQLLRRSQADVYGLLEQMGRETAGALSIGAPESLLAATYRELDQSELSKTIRRLPARPLLADDDDVTMSLAGAQAKLAVAVFDGRISLPLHGAASTHILKPASDRLYATVENELLCMRLAERVGVPVARTSMGAIDDLRYLLVERYDRRVDGERRVHRMHQEDFCQALGYYPTQKYEARRGPGLTHLFADIDRHSCRAARDRLHLLDLVIFACGIGDTDRHGKNFAWAFTDAGPVLAPGYDLLTSLPYDGITRNLAMKIAGKNRADYLERRHWERFARSVNLAPAGTVRRVEQLAAAMADQVGVLAKDLAAEFPYGREAFGLFAEAIATQTARVAANSRRGPSANEATEENDR